MLKKVKMYGGNLLICQQMGMWYNWGKMDDDYDEIDEFDEDSSDFDSDFDGDSSEFDSEFDEDSSDFGSGSGRDLGDLEDLGVTDGQQDAISGSYYTGFGMSVDNFDELSDEEKNAYEAGYMNGFNAGGGWG